MCKCTPTIRTPFCGRGDCVNPAQQKPEGARQSEAVAPTLSQKHIRAQEEEIARLRGECSKWQQLAESNAQLADIAQRRTARDAPPQAPAVGDDTKRRSCCGNCGQPMGPLTCCEKEDDQPWVSAEEGDRIRKALATTKEKNNG